MARTTDDLLHLAARAILDGAGEALAGASDDNQVCLVFDFAALPPGELPAGPLVELGDLGERGARSLIEQARRRAPSGPTGPITLLALSAEFAIRVLRRELRPDSLIVRLLGRPTPHGQARVVVIRGRTVALCSLNLSDAFVTAPSALQVHPCTLGAVIIEMIGLPPESRPLENVN